MSKKAVIILLLLSALFFYVTNNLLHGLHSQQIVLKTWSPNSSTPFLKYKVITTYKHEDSFTEGIVYDAGALYESSGLYNRSTLIKFDLQSGQRLVEHHLPAADFAEGIALVNDEIYQLTYREHVVFVYDKTTLQLKRQLTYDGEGWGLTTDGRELMLSDGTYKLRFIDPATMKVNREVNVHDQSKTITGLNSLQYVDGKIFANIFPTNKIAMINAANGEVMGWLDVRKLDPYASIHNLNYVTNGIAYIEPSKTLLITGKHWPHLYEIQLIN